MSGRPRAVVDAEVAGRDPADVAILLTPAQRRGILSKPGARNFSLAVERALIEYGLLDPRDRFPTDLGWEVRTHLGGGGW